MAKAVRLWKQLNFAQSRSSGVAGTARSNRKALNVRDLVQIERFETGRTRPKAKAFRLSEESEKLVVPMKATKAAGGKGLHLGLRQAR
jgi:hypothetical protein